MEIALHARERERREAAAYALGYLSAGNETQAVIKALVNILDNDPAPPVRGQAAESLTQLLRFRGGQLRETAESVLIRHLDDEAAEARFWCAYAVGELRSKAAVPALRRLTRDRTVIPRWWSVGAEARDALTAIRSGIWPERIGADGERPKSRGTTR